MAELTSAPEDGDSVNPAVSAQLIRRPDATKLERISLIAGTVSPADYAGAKPIGKVVPTPEFRYGISALPERVWYFSYGSNMFTERFRYYISGGGPEGAKEMSPGCGEGHDTFPAEYGPVALPGGMYFGRFSRAIWDGGVAFYDERSPGLTLGKAYLITLEQFKRVVQQEKGPDLNDGHIVSVLQRGSLTQGADGYNRIVCPGHLAVPGRDDSYPIFTFTSHQRATEADPLSPVAPYERIIADGVMQAHGLTAHQTALYLTSAMQSNGSHLSRLADHPAAARAAAP